MIPGANPTIDELGGGRFAEVVADRAQHHGDLLGVRQVVDTCAGLVDHQHRMDPDITLWMPLGLLFAADERLEFREQLVNDAQFER